MTVDHPAEQGRAHRETQGDRRSHHARIKITAAHFVEHMQAQRKPHDGQRQTRDEHE
jgi:hypothetical protein